MFYINKKKGAETNCYISSALIYQPLDAGWKNRDNSVVRHLTLI